MLQNRFGFSMPAFTGNRWIAPLFASATFFYGDVPFLQMAVPDVKDRAGYPSAPSPGQVDWRRLSRDYEYLRCHDLCRDSSHHGAAFSSTSRCSMIFQMASDVS
jgi:hypothetical protein